MHRRRADRKKGKPKKYGLEERLGDGMQLTVEEVHIHLKLKGISRDIAESGPWTPPIMKIVLKNLQLCTTDHAWNVVDLKKAIPKPRKSDHHIVIFKKGSIDDVSVYLSVHPSLETFDVPILLKQKARIETIYKRRVRGSQILSIYSTMYFERMQMELSASALYHLLHVSEALGQCLYRVDALHIPAEDEVRYELLLRLSVALLRAHYSNPIIFLARFCLAVDWELLHRVAVDQRKSTLILMTLTH
jgi:hypothetical protein